MYQQITIVGNVGSDAEMRYTSSGVPVTSFSVAVNKSWAGQDGKRQEKATWFRVTAWRKLAEIVAEYVTKGRQVLVIGEIEEAKPWTDKEGNQRASLEITAQVVRVIGKREDGDGEEGGSSRSGDRARQDRSTASQDSNYQDNEDIPF